MYKAFAPEIIKKMEENGSIVITIKPGWEHVGNWACAPSNISYWLGSQRERIFTCYLSRESSTVQITNVAATRLIADKKGLVDAYMYLALKGMIEFAKTAGVKRLIVDSFIPALADHMLDQEFHITPKGLSGGCRGCKTLKD